MITNGFTVCTVISCFSDMKSRFSGSVTCFLDPNACLLPTSRQALSSAPIFDPDTIYSKREKHAPAPYATGTYKIADCASPARTRQERFEFPESGAQ